MSKFCLVGVTHFRIGEYQSYRVNYTYGILTAGKRGAEQNALALEI
jgi:hypothetical protein